MSQNISIALITFNRVNFLRKNVPLLFAQLKASCELLIINNNSTDETSKYLNSLSHPSLKTIFVPKQGLNVCRNIAIRNAKHDWVAFIDDDASPEYDWLEAFYDSIINRKSDDIAIYAGRTFIEYQTTNPSYLSPKFLYLLGGKDYGETNRLLTGSQSPGGGNMMVNRHLILSLGGFDECFDRRGKSLLSNGETELVDKVYAQELKIMYISKAVIHHWAGAERLNKKWLLKRMYWQGISDGLLAKKRRRSLRLFGKRFLSHMLKIPSEIVLRIANPRLAFFTIQLEIAKSLGILKSFTLDIENV